MKRKVISLIVICALASSIICSNAFVVDTKAVSDGIVSSEMINAIKEGVENYHQTHIKNEDGSRTVIQDNYKKIKATKKRNSLPSSYVAPYTPVKDQNVFGCCWMFGEVASLESNLMFKAGYQGGLVESNPIDLSEAQGVFVQYNRQTKSGAISGEILSDSSNDCEKNNDGYYGYAEGGWQYDATMSVSADKGAAFESENPYRSNSSSTTKTDSKAMAQIAASQYRLNRFNIKSAEGLPEIFPITLEHGQNVRNYNPEARNIWKEKIVSNGAISANYYHSSSSKYNTAWGFDDEDDYEDAPNFWYYDANAKNKYSTNHVITVVGYNDNYSRYHYISKYTSQSYDTLVGEIVYIKCDAMGNPKMSFNSDGRIDSIETSDSEQSGYEPYIVPKEDGAWIIKNSYGVGTPTSKMFDDGIMYTSYCEETLSESISSAVEENLNQINNNKKVYDTTLTHSSIMGSIPEGFDEDGKAAEIYSISGDKDIELGQIGYWTGEENTVSRFKIYGSLSDENDPESGTLLYDSGDISDPYVGYHTADLEEIVTLERSTKMSVVTTQVCDGESGLMIELEYVNDPDYLINCLANDTKYFDEDEWIDAKDLDSQAREEGLTVGNSTVKLFGNVKKKKYTVTVDGNENIVEEGDSFTFPTTSANGYANADYSVLYASGQTITPEENITVSSIQNFDFSMVYGASVDLLGRDGIRFCATANCSDEDFFQSSNVECGTLITPQDIFIDELEEKLDLDVAEQAGNTKVLKVVNSGWDQGIVGRFAAGVINIKQFSWSRPFLAKAYLKMNYSNGSSKVLYTDLSVKRSIRQVVENLRDMGYPDLSDEQIEMLQKYLD